MSRSNRSDSDISDPGAAQFIANLSPRQLQHLQFSVPKKGQPDRFSQFLEEPRQVPVPKRFTFDPQELARLKEAKEKRKDEGKGSAQHARSKSEKSTKSLRTVKSVSDVASSSRVSVDLLKEVEKVANVDWRFYSTGACICLLNLIAAWDATTLSISLPTIATELGGSAFETFWLSISFLAAATCFLPLFATFSDIFGRKAMLLTAVTFFTAGSFIAAVTGNITGLHLGRSVQGIGAGGIYALSTLIVSDLTSAVDRRKWTVILGASWAIGAITGPVISGALADHGQWRWIFWLHLPFCAIAFIILPCFAQLKAASQGSVLPKLRNVDWLSFILFFGSLISILLGLTWGGTLHPWSNFRTTLPIQFGLIGLLVFLVWCWFSPFRPMISIGEFLTLTNLATYFGAIVHSMIAISALYFLPLYFSIAKPSLSLVETGACLIAWTIPIAIFALIAFFIIDKTTFFRPVAWFGWFLVVIGIALMIIFTPNTKTVTWLCIAIVSGAGLGILYPSLSTASTLCVESGAEDGKLSKAVTNFAFFQTLGQTLGVAVSTAIFQNQLLKQLLNNVVLQSAPLRLVNDSLAKVEVVRSLSAIDDTLKAQVTDAYVDAISIIWIVMAALGGAAMMASFFMRTTNRRRAQEIEMKNLDGVHAA